MEQLKQIMRSMIDISDEEFSIFYNACQPFSCKKNELLSSSGIIPHDIFFIKKGIVRVFITDEKGIDHTIHFATENQFITDYTHYILNKPAVYSIQALEATDFISIPRSIIDWAYEYMQQGNKMGRLIAEYYFIYQDDRISNRYVQTPKERYDFIDTVFPSIHQRVPQHMIASYLGITPIHLSRLKNSK
uniref:Crp/Fnr family transcriptional regulator n=1 Tax=Fluviicola sp. TaxID=1917219 RepID=UPI004048F6CB